MTVSAADSQKQRGQTRYMQLVELAEKAAKRLWRRRKIGDA